MPPLSPPDTRIDQCNRTVDTQSNGVGIQIDGTKNEVRGSTTELGTTGIRVTGAANVLRSNHVEANAGLGIEVVSGNTNTVESNTVLANALGGIKVTAPATSGTVVEGNDVMWSGQTGILLNGTQSRVSKNDVGDRGSATLGDGIVVVGNGNQVLENDVFASTGRGIVITGNTNTIMKNDVGDKGKGNWGDGVRIAGNGNTLTANSAYANDGNGFNVSGGTKANPNKLVTNTAGSVGKGNQLNGILVVGVGSGTSNPIELEGNVARANTLVGIRLAAPASGHQLKSNSSGGASSENNGGCEYLVVGGNLNGTGNRANNVLIPGANNSAFPTACQGSP